VSAQDSRVLPEPAPTSAHDAETLELALLEGLVHQVPLPSPELPGWQSLTAREYELAVRELSELLTTVAAALAAARTAA
jgi:hypothetical protein